MKLLTVIIFCLFVVSGYAQDLQGKWMPAKEGDTYIIPENLILEVKEDSIHYYSFDQLVSSHFLQVQANKILIENGGEQTFEFINDDRILIKDAGLADEINTPNSMEFVRLVPTETKLSKEEIEGLSFKFNLNGEKIKIEFNKELKPHLLGMVKKSEYSRILLEKIDSTYFASVYKLGKRTEMIPIKEVDKNKMTIYGIPGEPYEIEGQKI